MVLKQIPSAGHHSIYVCTSVVLSYLLRSPQLLSWAGQIVFFQVTDIRLRSSSLRNYISWKILESFTMTVKTILMGSLKLNAIYFVSQPNLKYWKHRNPPWSNWPLLKKQRHKLQLIRLWNVHTMSSWGCSLGAAPLGVPSLLAHVPSWPIQLHRCPWGWWQAVP